MTFRLLMLGTVLALALGPSASPSAQTPPPAEVQVSVHINDVQQVNLRTHSFYADFYLGFRWRDRELEPVKTLTWMNPFQLWAHTSRPMTDGPRSLPDGSLFEWVRYRGEFNTTLPLHNYPFDRQVLVAEFADRAVSAARMAYVPGAVSVAREISLPGYLVGTPRLVVSETEGLGAVEALMGAADARFTPLRIEIPIARPWLPYAVKLLLPLFMATGCAALMFLVPARFVEARIGLGITSILILVALQLTLNADLPEVDYLMALDEVYLASYLFDFVAIVLVAWVTSRHLGDLESPRIRVLDRRILAGLGAAYVTLVVMALTIGRGT